MQLPDKRSVTFSWTGHRPSDLDGGYAWNNPKNKDLPKMMKITLNNLIKNDRDKEYCFISGGCIGVDFYAFSIVEDLKKSGYVKSVKQILAIPFLGQENKWPDESIYKYTEMYLSADSRVIVDEIDGYNMEQVPPGIYNPMKMQNRNMWMVDNSDILIAIWSGKPTGGTANCVNYAKKLGKPIVVLNPITYLCSEM